MGSKSIGKVSIDCVPQPAVYHPLRVTPSRSMTARGMVRRTERSRCPALLRFGAEAFLLAVTACGGDDILLPRDGEPAHIAVFHGNDQSAAVGQPLQEALVAEVTDPAGRPVQGVEVTFGAPVGAVVDPATPVKTDAAGHAAVQYTLSTTAGDQMVEARAPIVPE